MRKYLALSIILLGVLFIAAGCNSSASRCFTKNGSRVPSQTYANNAAATVPAPVYPMEDVIYTSAAGQCNPCAPSACDPCGPATSCNQPRTAGTSYPTNVLPGL